MYRTYSRGFLSILGILIACAASENVQAQAPKRLTKSQLKHAKEIDGNWYATVAISGDGKLDPEFLGAQFHPEYHFLQMSRMGSVGAVFAMSFDPDATPKRLDFGVDSPDGFLGLGLDGIYRVSKDGQQLRVAYGKKRPKSFLLNGDSETRYLHLVRAREGGTKPHGFECLTRLAKIHAVCDAYQRKNKGFGKNVTNTGRLIQKLVSSKAGRHSGIEPTDFACQLSQAWAETPKELDKETVSYRFLFPLPSTLNPKKSDEKQKPRPWIYCRHKHEDGRYVIDTQGQISKLSDREFDRVPKSPAKKSRRSKD